MNLSIWYLLSIWSQLRSAPEYISVPMCPSYCFCLPRDLFFIFRSNSHGGPRLIDALPCRPWVARSFFTLRVTYFKSAFFSSSQPLCWPTYHKNSFLSIILQMQSANVSLGIIERILSYGISNGGPLGSGRCQLCLRLRNLAKEPTFFPSSHTKNKSSCRTLQH